MSFEKPNTPKVEREENFEEHLIRTLRAEGLYSETSRKLFREWWDRRESMSEDERWQTDLKRADVLFAAGLVQESLDQYATIAQEAYEAQVDTIVEECDRQIAEITSHTSED